MILIDLNVLLDVLQKRQAHYSSSSALIDRALSAEHRPLIPGHAVTTIHYLVSKYANHDKANQATDWLLEHFDVAPVATSELKRARALNWPDFEDAVVAACAESSQCQAIITRNVADFRGSLVPARTPEEHLLIGNL